MKLLKVIVTAAVIRPAPSTKIVSQLANQIRVAVMLNVLPVIMDLYVVVPVGTPGTLTISVAFCQMVSIFFLSNTKSVERGYGENIRS